MSFLKGGVKMSITDLSLNNIEDSEDIEILIDNTKNILLDDQNLGLNLIDMLSNSNVVKCVYHKAENSLISALCSYTGSNITDIDIVFISLVLIALENYDGNFYENVVSAFPDLYKRFSEQKINGLIRTIADKYRNENSKHNNGRKINTILKHTIVPKHYLPAFFEFIYDIYKYNFEYNLPERIEDEFRFVYEGLYNNMMSDGDEIKINVTRKTYKLIKSTKELIAEQSNLDAIITLSVEIAKLIDNRIWHHLDSVENPYYNYGLTQWEKSISDKEAKQKKQRHSSSKSRWKPRLCLIGNDVYLVPPIHRIKSNYDYKEISIKVYNNNTLVFCDNKVDVREIIGGYQIIPDKIKISCPLGNLSYQFCVGDEILYDSKEALYRKFIIFDSNGKEIKNNSDFQGTIVVCYNEQIENISPYYCSENYSLFPKNVSQEDTLVLSDTVFSFSSITKPGLFGDKIDNCYLEQTNTGEFIQIYKNIKFLVFETNIDTLNYVITINNQPNKISEFEYNYSENQGKYRFVVKLDMKFSGVFKIQVACLSNGKSNVFFSSTIAIDNGFSLNLQSNHMIKFNSNLFESRIIPFSDSNYQIDNLRFRYDGIDYNYILPLNYNLYSIYDGVWCGFNNKIWIGDIIDVNEIKVYGSKYTFAGVYSPKGEVLHEKIPIKYENYYCRFPSDILLQYRMIYDFVILIFTGNNDQTGRIICANKCLMENNGLSFHFDPANKELSLRFRYFGKGNVYLRVVDDKKKLVYTSDYFLSGQILSIPQIKSFKTYQFEFCEKSSSLFMNKERILEKSKKTFYAWDDFVGHVFKIKKVHYDEYRKGIFVRNSFEFDKIYIRFISKISSDVFIGDLIAKNHSGKNYYFNGINPVTIEICSGVVENEVEISITKYGDGLLLDKEHQSIMDCLDNNNVPDIFSYIMDVSEVTK